MKDIEIKKKPKTLRELSEGDEDKNSSQKISIASPKLQLADYSMNHITSTCKLDPTGNEINHKILSLSKYGNFINK